MTVDLNFQIEREISMRLGSYSKKTIFGRDVGINLLKVYAGYKGDLQSLMQILRCLSDDSKTELIKLCGDIRNCYENLPARTFSECVLKFLDRVFDIDGISSGISDEWKDTAGAGNTKEETEKRLLVILEIIVAEYETIFDIKNSATKSKRNELSDNSKLKFMTLEKMPARKLPTNSGNNENLINRYYDMCKKGSHDGDPKNLSSDNNNNIEIDQGWIAGGVRKRKECQDPSMCGSKCQRTNDISAPNCGSKNGRNDGSFNFGSELSCPNFSPAEMETCQNSFEITDRNDPVKEDHKHLLLSDNYMETEASSTGLSTALSFGKNFASSGRSSMDPQVWQPHLAMDSDSTKSSILRNFKSHHCHARSDLAHYSKGTQKIQDPTMKLKNKKERLIRQLNSARRRMKKMEEEFENIHSYRPSHRDKHNDEFMSKCLQEEIKLQKQIRNLHAQDHGVDEFKAFLRDYDRDDDDDDPIASRDESRGSIEDGTESKETGDLDREDVQRKTMLDTNTLSVKRIVRRSSTNSLTPLETIPENEEIPLTLASSQDKLGKEINEGFRLKDENFMDCVSAPIMRAERDDNSGKSFVAKQLENGLKATQICQRDTGASAITHVNSEHLHFMNKCDLLEVYKKIKKEKKYYRRLICSYEENSRFENGELNNFEREDKLKSMYHHYKNAKSKFKLVEALLSKDGK